MEGPWEDHPLDGYDFLYVLGRGGFGLVKLAWHLASEEFVAVKILPRGTSPSSPLWGPGARSGTTCCGRAAEAQARALFGQVLAAVSYCHGQRVAHRDLKLGNLLLDTHLNVKLADFGLSLWLEQGTLVRGFCGTPEYCAPEVFLGEDYDAVKADVWSLGVVLFAMLAATLPFHSKDTDEMWDMVLSACYVLPHAVSPALQELLVWLPTVDTSRRPSAEEARTHWWFSPGRKAAQEDKEDAVTLLQPLGVPRDPEANDYLAGLGLLPGMGTEGTPGPRPHGPTSLPESSQSSEHHPIQDDGLALVSRDSMAVNVSSTRSDSTKASS
nr:serine/threonine-protein kinase MARK2-like [Oryctolagus cuniculus]